MALGFLNNFKKSIEKMQSVTTDFAPPAHWFHTGNFALNRSLSGSYRRGIPLGRVSVLAGESGCITQDEMIEVRIGNDYVGFLTIPEVMKRVEETGSEVFVNSLKPFLLSFLFLGFSSSYTLNTYHHFSHLSNTIHEK